VDLAKLLQAPQGFLQALPVGPQHLPQRGAAALGFRGESRAHVAPGVPRLQQVRGVLAQGVRQVVPQALQLGGQEGIVEREARMVLQHAEGLAGSVGAGVQHAGQVGLLGGVAQAQGLFQLQRRRPARQEVGLQARRAQPVVLQRPAQDVAAAQQRQQQGLADDRVLAGQVAGQHTGVPEGGMSVGVQIKVRRPGGRRGRCAHVAPVSGVVQAGADRQDCGPPFLFLEQAVQQVERLHAVAAAGAGVPLGCFQGAGHRRGQLGQHGSARSPRVRKDCLSSPD
jgi:hypothetical protein